MVIDTRLRLADDSTVEITITPSANGGSEWEPIAIDGMAAAHWLKQKGYTSDYETKRRDAHNEYQRKRYRSTRSD